MPQWALQCQNEYDALCLCTLQLTEGKLRGQDRLAVNALCTKQTIKPHNSQITVTTLDYVDYD